MKETLISLMKNILYSFIGFISKKFIKQINYYPNDRNKACFIFQENLFHQKQYPLNIRQIEFDSLNIDLLTKTITIDDISLSNDSETDISSQSKAPKKFVFRTFFTLLLTIFNFLFGRFINSIMKPLFAFIIRKIIKNTTIIINSINIDLKIPVNDQNEAIQLKTIVKSTNFILKKDFNFNATIESFQIELKNNESNKTIVMIEAPTLELMRKSMKSFTFDSKSAISIYFSIFDSSILIDLFKKAKTIKMDEIFAFKNHIKKRFEPDLDINIENMNFFIIKSNLPLLLLSITPNEIKYPFFRSDFETKIEIKFELKHLCHRTYNVISNFSTEITINNNNNNVDVIVSPIQTTLSAFLVREIFAAEIKDSLHSSLQHQYEKVFFQNDTKEVIKLTLIKKNSNDKYSIELESNIKKEIKEQEFESDVKVDFIHKNYYFSIDSLYSSIFLDKNIIVILTTKGGINTIHFSSPYLIRNRLSYDIEACFNDQNPLIIEKKKDQFIPCKINFNLSEKIKVAMLPSHSDYVYLDFKSQKPIKFIDRKNKIKYYSTYFLSFDSQKSICSITFMPFVIVTNYLPYDVHLKIKNITTLELKQRIPVDLSFVKGYKSDLEFILDFGDFAIGNKIIKKSRIENFKEEVFLFKNGEKIGQVIFKCSEKRKKNKTYFDLSIYSPLILENESNIPLSLHVSKCDRYKFIDKKILYNSETLMSNDYLIKLPIVYEKLTNVNWLDFKYLDGFSQMIPLQHERNNKIFLFLTLEKKEGNCNQSSIVTIQPYFKIHSDINETVKFLAFSKNKDAHQEFENICIKGDNVILGSNENGYFDIIVDGYQRCKDFNLFNLGSTVIRLAKKDNHESFLLIKLVVEKEKIGYCCNLSYPTKSSDISIKNKLSNMNIYVHQHYQPKLQDFEFHPIILYPDDESIFTKEQPFLANELKNKYNFNVSFGDDTKLHLLSFEEDCHSKRIDETSYLYDVENIDRENINITIYESSESCVDNENNKNRNATINYSILLYEIQLSYIDIEMHELFLLAMTYASLKVDKEIKFTIAGFALNDMYTASLSPVVLNGKESPFLDIEIDSKYPLKALMFDSILINFAPIQIFVDFVFVSDLIAAMKEIVNYVLQLKIKHNFLLKIFSTKKLSINKISLFLIPKSLPNRKFRFKHRDYYNLSSIKIPFLSKIKFDFNGINLLNIESSVIGFIRSISDNYKNQITFKKALSTLLNAITTTSTESKKFDDFLNNKLDLHSDFILEFPRRIPRCFPNGRILNIPTDLNSNYPDSYTFLQYFLQNHSKEEYGNEQLKELYNDYADNNKLAIFDNLIFIFSTNESIKIHYKEIRSISNSKEQMIIKSINKNYHFNCKTEQDAKSIANKVNYFIQKIKISEQFVANI